MAQMRVGQPCTPTNVVWKGGLVRNLPDRDEQRGCAKPSTIRRATANSLSRANRNLLQVLQSPFPLFNDLCVGRYLCEWAHNIDPRGNREARYRLGSCKS